MHEVPLYDVYCDVQGMLQDSNPMVVANAVAALAEIQELSGKEVFQVTNTAVFKLLAALNECTEWGQVLCIVWMWCAVASVILMLASK